MAELQRLVGEPASRDVSTENVQLYVRRATGRLRTAVSTSMLESITATANSFISVTGVRLTGSQVAMTTSHTGLGVVSRDGSETCLATGAQVRTTVAGGTRVTRQFGSKRSPIDVACENTQLYLRKRKQTPSVITITNIEVHQQSYEYVSSLQINLSRKEGQKSAKVLDSTDGESGRALMSDDDQSKSLEGSYSIESPKLLLPGSDYGTITSPKLEPGSGYQPIASPGIEVEPYVLEGNGEGLDVSISVQGGKSGRDSVACNLSEVLSTVDHDEPTDSRGFVNSGVTEGSGSSAETMLSKSMDVLEDGEKGDRKVRGTTDTDDNEYGRREDSKPAVGIGGHGGGDQPASQSVTDDRRLSEVELSRVTELAFDVTMIEEKEQTTVLSEQEYDEKRADNDEQRSDGGKLVGLDALDTNISVVIPSEVDVVDAFGNLTACTGKDSEIFHQPVDVGRVVDSTRDFVDIEDRGSGSKSQPAGTDDHGEHEDDAGYLTEGLTHFPSGYNKELTGGDGKAMEVDETHFATDRHETHLGTDRHDNKTTQGHIDQPHSALSDLIGLPPGHGKEVTGRDYTEVGRHESHWTADDDDDRMVQGEQDQPDSAVTDVTRFPPEYGKEVIGRDGESAVAGSEELYDAADRHDNRTTQRQSDDPGSTVTDQVTGFPPGHGQEITGRDYTGATGRDELHQTADHHDNKTTQGQQDQPDSTATDITHFPTEYGKEVIGGAGARSGDVPHGATDRHDNRTTMDTYGLQLDHHGGRSETVDSGLSSSDVLLAEGREGRRFVDSRTTRDSDSLVGITPRMSDEIGADDDDKSGKKIIGAIDSNYMSELVYSSADDSGDVTLPGKTTGQLGQEQQYDDDDGKFQLAADAGAATDDKHSTVGVDRYVTGGSGGTDAGRELWSVDVSQVETEDGQTQLTESVDAGVEHMTGSLAAPQQQQQQLQMASKPGEAMTTHSVTGQNVDTLSPQLVAADHGGSSTGSESSADRPSAITSIDAVSPVAPVTRPTDVNEAASDVEHKLSLLKDYWKVLEQQAEHKELQVQQATELQNHYTEATASITNWLDCINLQTLSAPDADELVEPQLLQLQSTDRELHDLEQAAMNSAPGLLSSGAGMSFIHDALRDVQSRLAALERERKLKEQQLQDRKLWMRKLEDELTSQEVDVSKCEGELTTIDQFNTLTDTVTPLSDRQQAVDRLEQTCTERLNELKNIQLDINVRQQTDPTIPVPAKLSVLLQRWQEVLIKLQNKKSELSVLADAALQYEEILQQYSNELQIADTALTMTDRPVVENVSQLEEQLANDKEYFADLLSRQSLLDELVVKVDGNTRDRHHMQHSELLSLADTVRNTATIKQQQLERDIEHWRDFQHRLTNVNKQLDSLDQTTATNIDSGATLENLQVALDKFHESEKQLESLGSEVFEVIDLGELVLADVDSTALATDVSQLRDKHKTINNELVSHLKRLETLVKQLNDVNSDADQLETWMSQAKLQLADIKGLIAAKEPSADMLLDASQSLQELTNEHDRQKSQQINVSTTGSQLVTARPGDSALRGRLKQIDDKWRDLASEFVVAKEQLSKAQELLLPSTQARNELLAWMTDLRNKLALDAELRPTNSSDVHQLHQKYQLLKTDVLDHQQTLDYINECSANSSNDSAPQHLAVSAVSAENYAEINRQYRQIASDVENRFSDLALILSQWEEYDRSLDAFADSLEKSRVTVHELTEAGQGVETNYVIEQCKNLEDLLLTKHSDLKLVADKSVKMCDPQLWGADKEFLTKQLGDLNNKLSALENDLKVLTLSVESRQPLLNSYNDAVKVVRSDIDEVKTVMNNVELNKYKDIETLSAQLSRLKNAEQKFTEAEKNLKKLLTCTENLKASSSQDACQTFDSQTRQLTMDWHNEEQTLKGKIDALEKLETDWTEYETLLVDLQKQSEQLQNEIQELAGDSTPEHREQHLTQIQMLEDKLKKFDDNFAKFSAVSAKLLPQLDVSGLATITSKKTSIEQRIASQRQQLNQLRLKLEAENKLHKKFNDDYKLISDFLTDTATTEEAAAAKGQNNDDNSVAVRQQLARARDTLAKFSSNQPTLTELNEVGYQLPLTTVEADKLRELNQRWTELHERTSELIDELQQRLLQLQGFNEKCEEWSKFLSSVELELAGHQPSNYQTLLDDQQNIEKFEAERPSRYETLCSVVGEGESLLANGAISEDPGEFKRKLTALEQQWLNVVKQAEQRKQAVSGSLATWKDYIELREMLLRTLKELNQSTEQNPVTVGSVDTAKQLLGTYKELESKVDKCLPLEDKIKSLVQMLLPSTDQTNCQQLTSSVDNIELQHQTVAATVNNNIDRLQAFIKLWTDTQTELNNFTGSLQDVQKSLNNELPETEVELEDESCKLKEVDVSLSTDARLKQLKVNIDQLLTGVSSDEMVALTNSLGNVDKQYSETRHQVAARQRAIADRLRRWTDFDDMYNKLNKDIEQLDRTLSGTKTQAAEDVVSKIQTQFIPQLEAIGTEMKHWQNVGAELKKSSSPLQSRNIENKTTALAALHSKLDQSFKNRLKALTDLLANISRLDELMKELRQWLLEKDRQLAVQVVYNKADDAEIQRHLNDHKLLQSDVDAHSVKVASVLELCQSLEAETATYPVTANMTDFQKTMKSLDEHWNNIKSRSAERKIFIEGTQKAWQQFNTDYTALDHKLTDAEKQVKTFPAQGATFDEIKQKHEAVRVFRQKTLTGLLSDVHKLTTQYSQLARDGRTDKAGSLQQTVKQSNERCDTLNELLTAVELWLSAAVQRKKNFDSNLQSVLSWLNGLDKQLNRAAAVKNRRRRLDDVQKVKKNLNGNIHWLTNYDKAVDELVATCHASDAVTIRADADKVHTLHAGILKRIEELLAPETETTKQDKQSVDEVAELERSLDASMTSTSEILEDTMEEAGELDLLEDDEVALSLNVDLSALERWLKRAERILQRWRAKPRELVRFEHAFADLQKLLDEIEDWTPEVADIRSCTHGIVLQDRRTERLCERISQAIVNWNSVCARTPQCRDNLSSFLLTSDAFRISIDNLLARMKEARDGIVALDLRRLPAERSSLEMQTLPMDLDDIVRNLELMERRVNRLSTLSQYLVHSSRPAVGQEQISQLDAMAAELEAMKQSCLEYMTHVAGCGPRLFTDDLNSGEDTEDRFTALPSICYRRVIPPTSTWAGFHQMLGGEATLSDKRCNDDQLLALANDEVPAANENVLSRTRRSLLSRACRAAIPIQLMGFVFLGLAALIPVCDFCDLPPNSFLYSLYPLLRYTDGLPPL